MANIFTLILMIITLITCILWCLECFKLAPVRRQLISNKNTPQTNAKKTTSILSMVIHKLGWIKTCASIFPVLLFVLVVRLFLYEPYQIPSGSMMPTLLVGDFILVKKFAYGLKDPITQTTLIATGHPKRGDVVVFKYPPDPSVDYIKRVVGLSGDHVSYDLITKRIKIQTGCSSGKDCTTTLPITYSNIEPSNFMQILGSTESSIPSNSLLKIPLNNRTSSSVYLDQCQESLGGVVHNILLVPRYQDQRRIYYPQSDTSLVEWTVPESEYFMMGDNRDNSADSRYWGFVPEKNLVGKATAIWMSFEKQEGQLPTGIRLNRIGWIY